MTNSERIYIYHPGVEKIKREIFYNLDQGKKLSKREIWKISGKYLPKLKSGSRTLPPKIRKDLVSMFKNIEISLSINCISKENKINFSDFSKSATTRSYSQSAYHGKPRD